MHNWLTSFVGVCIGFVIPLIVSYVACICFMGILMSVFLCSEYDVIPHQLTAMSSSSPFIFN